MGDGSGDAWDVALKPIDGSTLVAKGLPNAVSVIATAERGSLIRAPLGRRPLRQQVIDALLDRDAQVLDERIAAALALALVGERPHAR